MAYRLFWVIPTRVIELELVGAVTVDDLSSLCGDLKTLSPDSLQPICLLCSTTRLEDHPHSVSPFKEAANLVGFPQVEAVVSWPQASFGTLLAWAFQVPHSVVATRADALDLLAAWLSR